MSQPQFGVHPRCPICTAGLFMDVVNNVGKPGVADATG